MVFIVEFAEAVNVGLVFFGDFDFFLRAVV